jgi:hypothetical protein
MRDGMMGLRVSLDGVTELHRDVSAECFNLQLCIVQTLLNHVPDADKTDKLAVLNNRKMAEPSLRHDVHDLGYGVMAGTEMDPIGETAGVAG